MKKRVKVAITGAAGQIGYAFLFRLAAGEVFGPDTEIEISLLELEAALPALRGTVLELQDCAFIGVKDIVVTSSASEAFAGADWAVLIGSVPRKAGMERKDLLAVNGGIFIEQGKALDRYAKKTCKVIVVGNPCNTNCYVAKTFAPSLPEQNFFALMMLDQTRAQAQLALKAGCPVAEVKNMAVWGNHSATQFPDYFHATIAGKPVLEVIPDATWLSRVFLEKVQKRGAEILQARGLSSAASAANSILRTMQALYWPTEEGEWFSVAVPSDGSYGVDKGLVFGFPVRFDGHSWSIVPGLTHDSFAAEKLGLTKKELLEEKIAVENIF